MTLPPMMTTFSGTSVMVRASELVMTRPPMSRPSVRDTEPVASTTLVPVYC
jgi:hypothetical protein